MMQFRMLPDSTNRRSFIGGSDARIIMGDNAAALLRLWKEKRGEIEPEDLSDDLLVQLGTVTEHLNRAWYERQTGYAVEHVQRRLAHPVHKWMAATLDGQVHPTGEVFEAKFMLPWNFSEEAAAEKHMAQLQHNMWVVAARAAVLSIITAAANGWKSKFMPTLFTSISCSRRRRSSGAASRPASPPDSSGWNRHDHASRRRASSI